jgi:putative DNA primase/helicase
MSANLQAALRLASVGLYVLPCDPSTKAPRLQNWPARATNKPEGVRYYWERSDTNSMPGIALGMSGLVVPDIDVKAGIDGHAEMDLLLDLHGELPMAPAVRTPSGGTHMYFRQPYGRPPLSNATGALPKGIDVRGARGQTIAPGAVKSDGTFYETVPGWPDLAEAFAAGTIPQIPEWIIDLIEQPNRLAPVRSGPSMGGHSGPRAAGDKSEWVARALDAEARSLAATGEGGRNNALNRLVYMFAGHAANGWTSRDEVYAAMWWACEANGYLAGRDPSDGPKQFDKTFNSAWRGGFKLPTKGPRERIIDPAFAARIQHLK